ncbi:conserved hypothetical protein, secreted [Candidatus Magnetomorum sp. HK-1]|nr:conserved hypothetical protein, secreted [Candidatus Magnetomorum sp. HK-1]
MIINIRQTSIIFFLIVFVLPCISIQVYASQQSIHPPHNIYDESQGRWIVGGTVEGWVRDSLKKGLSDVCITAFSSPCGKIRQQIVSTRSNGFFRFSGLAPQIYYLYADASCRSPQNLINSWWNGETGTSDCKKAMSLTIQDGEKKSHINFMLSSGKNIKGKVINQNGQPITDICVAATDFCAKHWYSGTHSDFNGQFSLMGLSANVYYLHINPNCSDNKYITESIWWAGGNLVTSDCQKAVSIAVNKLSMVSDINFQINVKPEVRGRVFNVHKKPIANVCINLKHYCEDEWFGSAYTDENGTFSFSNLPEGTFYLETSASCQNPQKYIDAWWNMQGGHSSCKNAEPINLTAPGQSYDFTLKAGNIIQGQVFKKNKIPIANVCVIASSQCRTVWYGQSITNEMGHYSLIVPDGTYYLLTDSTCDSQNHYVDQWWDGQSGAIDCQEASGIQVQNNQIKSHVDFKLSSGGILMGQILSNEKKPLADTCILVSRDCNQPAMIALQSNSEGQFKQKLLPGKYYIRTDFSCKRNSFLKKKQHIDSSLKPNVYMDQWWHSSMSVSKCHESEPIHIHKGKTSESINFVLSSGGGVSGRVMSLEGNVLSGIIINIYDQSGQTILFSTKSKTNGLFNLMIPSGSYLLRAQPSQNRKPLFYIDQWWNGKNGSLHAQGARQVLVQDNQIQKNIFFKLHKGGAVTGMVFSPGHNPIDDVRIIASDPQKDVTWSFSRSNKYGQYVISGLPEGLQNLRFDPVSASPHIMFHWTHGAVTEHTVNIEPGKIKHIEPFILPKGGAISGSIFTQEGEPIPDVCAVAVQNCGNIYFGQAITNAKGQYLIKGLPAGDYYVQTNISCKELSGDYIDMYWREPQGTPVCKKAHKIQVQKKYTTSEINFSLSKDIAFIGSVLNNSGDPIENVCVVVSDHCGKEWAGEALSDKNGKFMITGITPGSYFLHTEVSCYEDQPYSDQWWNSIENTPDCEAAELIKLTNANMKKPVHFVLPSQSEQVSGTESNTHLADGHFDEIFENGKIIINIKDGLLDLIVEGVPLENVLQTISRYTGIKVLLFGTLKEKIFFDKRQSKLDDILLDLINGRAGHIFIYSPDRLMTSYIFSKDGQLKPTALSANTGATPFSVDIKKPLNIMKLEEIEDILNSPDRVEEKIHTLGELIGYFDSQNALNLLKVSLNDTDEEVRMMAISVMNDLKDNHLAVDNLTQSLDRDMSPAVRALAAEALGEIGDKRAVQPLMNAINDPDAGVRDTIRRALKAIQGKP